MFRTILAFSVLAAGLLTSSAMASPTVDNALPAARAADSGGIVLAQDGNLDIYYDARGNRVIVDADTGKVIAIQPPQTRLDRRALRRQMRARELGRAPVEDDDRYYLDDPEDMARFRRRQLDDQGQLPGPPVDEYDPDSDRFLGGYPQDNANDGDIYPEAPKSAEPRPIQRQPLNEAAIDPAEPAAPSDQAALPPKTEGGKTVVDPSLSLGARQDVAALQVLLDRAGASPGVIDGRFGSNVDKALAAYNQITGSNLRSTDAVGIKAALAQTGGDAFANYTITPEDAAGPMSPRYRKTTARRRSSTAWPTPPSPKRLAERFHMDENYLKGLNPEADFNRPGTIIKVANFGRLVATPGCAHHRRQGQEAGASPMTPAASWSPPIRRPSAQPTRRRRPARIRCRASRSIRTTPTTPSINFKQGQNDKILTIPPGPNGPVGSVWIALDKPTYGIHGTPEPSKIGKTESHGCVRLTNWDARELAKLVSPGVTVEFVGGPSVDDVAEQVSAPAQ